MSALPLAHLDLSLRPVQVLDRAIEQQRLAHGILLYGESFPALEALVEHLCGKLLPDADTSETSPLRHPDCFTLRPHGRARQIRIGSGDGAAEPNTMRKLLRDLAMSSNQGGGKVGIIYEVDRMNRATANAFLKTLEEPPRDTHLFLLTTRPYDLLDTIRSRCVNVRIPTALQAIEEPTWLAWQKRFKQWLGHITQGPADAKDAANLILSGNGLILSFGNILENLADQQWDLAKVNQPPDITEEQKTALQVGLTKGIRSQLLREMEEALRHFSRGHIAGHEAPGPGPGAGALQAQQSVALMEKAAGLLEVNLKEEAALEMIVLQLLRIWTPRK